MLRSDDAAPFVAGRSAEALGRRVAPAYPGHIAAVLPADWMQALHQAAAKIPVTAVLGARAAAATQTPAAPDPPGAPPSWRGRAPDRPEDDAVHAAVIAPWLLAATDQEARVLADEAAGPLIDSFLIREPVRVVSPTMRTIGNGCIGTT